MNPEGAPTIPYGRQSISDQDIRAVVKVLRSAWLTQGPFVDHFERTVAHYCGANHAIAVNSATSALHIACLAVGLGPGNTAWTSPNTFVASANCALYCGAKIDFVDIDPLTYNMSAEKLEKKLHEADKTGSLPKVIIPVHFAGQSCEMKRIAELAGKYGITVIEDASHAIGGLYRGAKIGSCTYSDMSVFSFHPVKIVTTGEGGVVTTNSKDLSERLGLLRTHGITRDPSLMAGSPDGPWYYEQVELGFNYRMTDIQAALGTSQFSRLNEFIRRRHELAMRYNEELSSLPLVLPHQEPEQRSAFHLYVIRIDSANTDRSRLEVFKELRQRGIQVNVHYIPVHTQPYYRGLGFSQGDFPSAERYYKEAISLPLYPGLSDNDQSRVIQSVHEVLA